MSQTDIITLIIAGSGWILASLQATLSFFERKKKQNDDILLRTVEFFTGGSQKRSVGISLIEGLIKKKKSYHEIVAPLLANQFVYLLLSSDSKSAIHEQRNLVRIFFLLKSIIELNKSNHGHTRKEILNAITIRLDTDQRSKIEIPTLTLDSWKQQLEELA